MIDRNNLLIVGIITICIISIIEAESMGVKKTMGKKIINGWNLSHIALYFILGVLSPSNIYLWFTLGIIWEIIESILGKMYGTEYWHGNFEDLLYNAIGLLAGIGARTVYFGKIN